MSAPNRGQQHRGGRAVRPPPQPRSQTKHQVHEGADSTPDTGESFTLSATVSNDGDGAYYLGRVRGRGDGEI